MFADRRAAGIALAELVDQDPERPDLVLSLPRGGVLVGRPVADRLHRPLAALPVARLRVPQRPEIAMGAVALIGATGHSTVVRDEAVMQRFGVQDAAFGTELDRRREDVTRLADRFGTAPDVAARSVLIVDDGLATGSTMLAATRAVRAAGASRVVCAAPVASMRAVGRLTGPADAVRSLQVPEPFRAVQHAYADFGDTPDRLVHDCLAGP